jgi:branched-chain amino acid transport system substrate-binding protein
MFKNAKRQITATLCFVLLTATIVGCSNGVSTSEQPESNDTATEPIKIGVPLPLTGGTADSGQRLLDGIKYATQVANENGGVLGRQIELVIEDTKGEVNTATEVAEKLITQDKVFALVGGYGSTTDYGMLQGIQSYEPLFVHVGSSTVKLEEDFGEKDWYFHYFIWDYHRQGTLVKALSSLNPVPKTIAMMYEDGNYGTTSYNYLQQYLENSGIKLVLAESFKTGSADFSGLLNKVKAANADVVYLVGYTNDNISIVTQMAELEVPYDLYVFVGQGNLPEDFGDHANGLVFIDTWSRSSDLEGLSEWLEGMSKFLDGKPPVSTHAQAYAAAEILYKSINIAGELDKQKVIDVMGSTEFWTPHGNLKYSRSNKSLHQMLSEDSMVLVQFQEDGGIIKEVVTYPPAIKSGDIIYPLNKNK